MVYQMGLFGIYAGLILFNVGILVVLAFVADELLSFDVSLIPKILKIFCSTRPCGNT